MGWLDNSGHPIPKLQLRSAANKIAIALANGTTADRGPRDWRYHSDSGQHHSNAGEKRLGATAAEFNFQP